MDSLYFTISQELAQEWKVLYTTILYILSVHRRPAAAHSCRVYYTLRFTDDIIFCQMMFCSIACEEFSLSVPVNRIFTVMPKSEDKQERKPRISAQELARKGSTQYQSSVQ